MVIWLCIVIIIAQCVSIATADASKPTLIVVDSHVHSFGEFVKACCHRYNVNVIDVSSNRDEAGLVDATTSDGALQVGETVHDIDKSCAFCLSMSDNGLKLSEHIQKRLGLVGNRVANIIEDDYLVNDKLDQNGLDTAQQQLILTWDDLKEFLDAIHESSTSDKPLCVLKVPDVLSHGTTTLVCHDQNEAKFMLEKLRSTGINEEILVQEFVDGQEYRVETISKDGEIKVVGIWKYHTSPNHESSFPPIRQCEELVSGESMEGQVVGSYCIDALKCLRVKWGPAHALIKFSDQLGPKLLKVKPRWYHDYFAPIAQQCIGYDAVSVTLGALFQSDYFAELPRLPSLHRHGRVVRLLSDQTGEIRSMNHGSAFHALPSLKGLRLHQTVGKVLRKSAGDAPIHCGEAFLLHDDRRIVEQDYHTIVDLQSTLFNVDDGDTVSSEQERNEYQGDSGIYGPSSFVKETNNNHHKPFVSSNTNTPQSSDPVVQLHAVHVPPHQQALWAMLQLSRYWIVDFGMKKVFLNLLILYVVSHLAAQLLPLV